MHESQQQFGYPPFPPRKPSTYTNTGPGDRGYDSATTEIMFNTLTDQSNSQPQLSNQFSSLNIHHDYENRHYGGVPSTVPPDNIPQSEFNRDHLHYSSLSSTHQFVNDQYSHPASQPSFNASQFPRQQFSQQDAIQNAGVYESTSNFHPNQSFSPPQYAPPRRSNLPPIPTVPFQQPASQSMSQDTQRSQPPVPPMPPMPPFGALPNEVRSQSQPHIDSSRNIPPSLQNHFPPQDMTFSAKAYPGQAHPAYANGPIANQPQVSQRASSDGLPNPIEVAESNRSQCVEPFYTGQRGVMPPLVTTEFCSQDQGICNPRFIRSSLYSVPGSSDLLKTVGVPFSITVSPFARQHPNDTEIVISDLGPQGPVRCIRCKAYMNPFMNFVDGGRRFQCPLCSGLTEVSPEYFSHLDHTGRRIDAIQRPELCLGSYELLATAEYCKNNELPQAPAFVFLIDVSQSAIRSGLVQLFCSQFINTILPNLPKEIYEPDKTVSSMRIGFVTYDQHLHFYGLTLDPPPASHNDLSVPNGVSSSFTYGKPQMHIVADIDDVFVPAVEGFLIPPDPAAITSILEMIPLQFCMDLQGVQPGQTPKQALDSFLGPAIQAGLEALKAAKRPGKLFVFHSNLPTVEAPGKLKNREDRRLVGTDKEKTLLTPASDFYTGLGQLCVEHGCGVDLFLFPNSYTDVATISEISRITSGHVYKYYGFQADVQGTQFLSDLKRAVSHSQAFNATMRVRTSTGIRPVEFFGNFYMLNTTDIEMACVSSDMAVTIELRHDDKLQDGDLVFIQAACLYTSISGQRRLRIHNLSLPVTNSIGEVFRLVELDAHMNWLSKYSMRALLNRTHPQVLDDLTARTANTLASYRRNCTGGPGDVNSSPSELILPQNMKLFPLYIQCLMKSEAFASADGISIDDRCWQMFLVNEMDVKQSNSYLYPHLYPVHELSVNTNGDVCNPPAAIRCSYERLLPEGAYILDNGIHLFLWIGPNISSEWVHSVFSVPNVKQFEPEKIYDLYNLDNEISRNLCCLLRKIRLDHWHYTRLHVLRSGDKLEQWFRRFMVEDRISGNSISYVEYLCHIHKEVTSLLR